MSVHRAETGNDDFGARYYSSNFGRWLSPDWSSIPEPVPYANPANPQTLNLYAMVQDNPESFADLDGHDSGQNGNTNDNQQQGCNLAFGNGCPELVLEVMAGSLAEGWDPDQTYDALARWIDMDEQSTAMEYAAAALPQVPPSQEASQQQSQAAQNSANLQNVQMTLSTQGLVFIERHEGYSDTVYPDSAGNPTTGWGHLIKSGEDYSGGINKEQAEKTTLRGYPGGGWRSERQRYH
jgi:RHS repeat-associated protein